MKTLMISCQEPSFIDISCLLHWIGLGWVTVHFFQFAMNWVWKKDPRTTLIWTNIDRLSINQHKLAMAPHIQSSGETEIQCKYKNITVSQLNTHYRIVSYGNDSEKRWILSLLVLGFHGVHVVGGTRKYIESVIDCWSLYAGNGRCRIFQAVSSASCCPRLWQRIKTGL